MQGLNLLGKTWLGFILIDIFTEINTRHSTVPISTPVVYLFIDAFSFVISNTNCKTDTKNERSSIDKN